MKLSTRLMLGMVMLVFVATLAIGLLAYKTLIQSIYPAQLTHMQGDARLMAERLRATVHEAMGDVVVNATAPAVVQVMRARRKGNDEAEADWKLSLARLFASNLAAKREYLQLRLIGIDDSGRELVRVERSTITGRLRVVPKAELQLKGARPYFTETIDLPENDVYISPIELNREFGAIQDPPTPVVRVASPVYGPRGNVLGVIVINVDLRAAFERLRAAGEPGVEIYVTNSDGDYLLHPDPAREFAFETGAPDRLQHDFPELVDILQPMQASYQIARSIEDEKGETYAAAAAVEDLGGGVRFAILLVAPRGLVLAPADAILTSATMVGLVAIFTAVVLAFFLSRTIARPLARLTRSVERFDRGEPIRLPRNAPKEIDILATALQHHIDRERLFNAVVQSSADAILTLSLDGFITTWNRAAEELFGYTAEEAVGQPLKILIPDEHIDDHKKILGELRRGRPVAPIETVRVSKNGRRNIVLLSVSPVRSQGGDVTGASAIYRDIKAQKHADTMFRLAVDASPAAMIMTDRGGSIVLANFEATETFGFSVEDLVGMQIEELMPQRFRKEHMTLRGAFSDHPSKRYMGRGRDLRGLRCDGSEFPLEIALNPIEGPEGPMVLSVVIDITERMRAAAELKRRTDELQRSNAELQQFAFIASHDLQEPLRMVTSFCGLLKDSYGAQLGAEGREYIEFAVDGAHRMRRLINDLLDYSRLHARDVPVSEVSMGDVVSVVLLNLSEMIRERGAEILTGGLPTVIGNEAQLTQLFQNLIGNAMKFTEGPSPKVEITATLERGRWTFTVRDYGIGIDPSQKDEVFGVFQRLHTREEYAGTGIGLAICKRIVECHGGRIWIDSAPGKGTAIHFRLSDVAKEVLGGLEGEKVSLSQEEAGARQAGWAPAGAAVHRQSLL